MQKKTLGADAFTVMASVTAPLREATKAAKALSKKRQDDDDLELETKPIMMGNSSPIGVGVGSHSPSSSRRQ